MAPLPSALHGSPNARFTLLFLLLAVAGRLPAEVALEGDQAETGLGSTLSAAGDVDGDGLADVVAGAPGDDGGATNGGCVFVLLGSPSGLGTTSWDWEGTTTGEAVGTAVAGAGDVNGDGFSDVLVASDGAVHVFFGARGGLPATPDETIDEPQSGSGFGESIAGAGDVDRDGFDDFLIGGAEFEVGGDAVGRVWLYFGRASGFDPNPQELDGPQANALFGSAIAGAGDVDGDGYADILVGSPGYDSGANDDIGRVDLYHGSAQGVADTSEWNTIGEREGDRFGTSLSAGGDVDGNGFADFLVGAVGFDGVGGFSTDVGRLYLYRGCSGDQNDCEPVIGAEQPAVTGSGAGAAVAGAGDIDGDGYSDVLVGSPDYNDPSAGGGRIDLFLCGEGELDGVLPSFGFLLTGSGGENVHFGASAAGAGDTNGDGLADFVVGEPGYSSASIADAGRIYVYYGSTSDGFVDAPPDDSIFVRGDVDGSFGDPDGDDLDLLEGHLLQTGEKPVGGCAIASYDALDVNDNEHVTLADLLQLGAFLDGDGAIDDPVTCGTDPDDRILSFEDVDPDYRLAISLVSASSSEVVVGIQKSSPGALYGAAFGFSMAAGLSAPEVSSAASTWEVIATSQTLGVIILGNDFGSGAIAAAGDGELAEVTLANDGSWDSATPALDLRPLVTIGATSYRATLVEAVDEAAGSALDLVFIDHHPALPSGTATGFRRGDANDDGIFGIADPIFGLTFIFLEGEDPTCLDTCDIDDDGVLGLLDMILLLNHLFVEGPPPAAPYPDCGADRTDDALSCRGYRSRCE